MFFVYFLKSERNDKIYVGSTEKLSVMRLEDHNVGSNKWTRENGPFKLVYYERYYCLKDMKEREIFYKSGFRRTIRDIIIETVSAKGGPAYGRGSSPTSHVARERHDQPDHKPSGFR